MKREHRSYLDTRAKKGKYYAMIDNVIMISVTISSLILLYKIYPKRVGTGGATVITLTGVVGVYLPVVHLMYANYKTSLSNQKSVIAYEKKYIVGSYYFFAVLIGFFLALLSNDHIVSKSSQIIPIQSSRFYMNLLYLQFFLTLFFSLIRWVFAFDYYQSYYYKNKQSYAIYLYKWGFTVMFILIMLRVVSILIFR